MKVRGVASFPVVYLVKIFEGFCKVWATSYEEHRLFESYYIALREKTRLHLLFELCLVHKFVPSVGRANPAGEHRCQSALFRAAD